MPHLVPCGQCCHAECMHPIGKIVVAKALESKADVHSNAQLKDVQGHKLLL